MNTGVPQKISVALCTYNGEKFLREQLESIADQTRLPDELIVCDDVSSDSTCAILDEFAKSANFPVRLHYNPGNLGYVKNFEKAISLCHGDIIFLSDQDDRWRSDKIAVLESRFSDPAIGMVFSNATVIDEHGQPTGKLLWGESHFHEEAKQFFLRGEAYKTLYLKNYVSGCTMAFRSKWWPLIQPLPNDIPFIHDAWIALMTAIFSEAAFVDELLIEYRLHTNQSTAADRQVTPVGQLIAQTRNDHKKKHYRKSLQQIEQVRQRISRGRKQISAERYAYLQACLKEHEKHLKIRIHLPDNKLFCTIRVLTEAITGRYHRFSNGCRSVVADLLGRKL